MRSGMELHDSDLASMNPDELRAEAAKLRAAIRLHRDEKGHDRCWLDDERLYAAVGDGASGDLRLPPRCEFLENCARYWEQRRNPVAAEKAG